MRRILIIEPLCSGHRSSYVRWSEAAFRKKGHTVQIATLEKSAPLLSSQEFQETDYPANLLKLPDVDLPTSDTVNTFSLVKKELAYWRLFRKFYLRSAATFAPDLVFVPYTDYCANAISIKGSPFESTPWAGIVMRPAFHLAKMGIVGPRTKLLTAKRRLFKRLLRDRTLRALFTIDETLYSYCRKTWSRKATKLSYLPDPAELTGSESRDQARQVLGIPQKPIILLAYGSLGLNKGIDELLRAAQRSDFPFEINILLAGRQDQTISDLLKSQDISELVEHHRVHQINRFLTPNEEFRVFAASDIVWLGYRGHFNMSGVLVQAGKMGLPVVACSEGLVGWLVREHKLGITVEIRDSAKVAQAINQFVDDLPGARLFGQTAKQTFASHTPEVFGRALTDRLELDPADPTFQTLLPEK